MHPNDLPTTTQQLLPLKELKNLERYQSVQGNLYQAIRINEGALLKDFCCAIPKHFPQNGVYSQSRIFHNKKGGVFRKRYTIQGDFKESDEDERLFLTAFWKITNGETIRFQCSISDYLKFRGLAKSGKNTAKLKNYLERTRSNTWKLNFWFDYDQGEYKKEKQYGVIQDFEIISVKSSKNRTKDIIVITWSQAYYEACMANKSWKYFDLESYTALPAQSGLAKKLLFFLGQGNNEFMQIKKDHVLVKIDLKTLCEFYLAMSQGQGVWKYKQNLKPALETLRENDIVRFENIDQCFIKEGKLTYLLIKYFPQGLKDKQCKISSLLIDERLYYQVLVEQLLPKLGKTVDEFEKEFLGGTIIDSSQSIRDIAFFVGYVIWGNREKEGDKSLVKSPKIVFQRLLGLSGGKWDIQPKYIEYWKRKVEKKINQQLKEKETELHESEASSKKFQSIPVQEQYEVALSFIKNNYFYKKLPELQQRQIEKEIQLDLPEYVKSNSEIRTFCHRKLYDFFLSK